MNELYYGNDDDPLLCRNKVSHKNTEHSKLHAPDAGEGNIVRCFGVLIQ